MNGRMNNAVLNYDATTLTLHHTNGPKNIKTKEDTSLTQMEDLNGLRMDQNSGRLNPTLTKKYRENLYFQIVYLLNKSKR